MMDWNLTLGLELVDSEQNIDRLMEALAPVHVAGHSHPHEPDKLGATITVTAVSMVAAIDVARAMVAAGDLGEITSLEIMPTATFHAAAERLAAMSPLDGRSGATALPPLLGVGAAAEILGKSPSTVRRWIGSKLVGREVEGSGWAITADSVERQAKAMKHAKKKH